MALVTVNSTVALITTVPFNITFPRNLSDHLNLLIPHNTEDQVTEGLPSVATQVAGLVLGACFLIGIALFLLIAAIRFCRCEVSVVRGSGSPNDLIYILLSLCCVLSFVYFLLFIF